MKLKYACRPAFETSYGICHSAPMQRLYHYKDKTLNAESKLLYVRESD